ncbi:MAG TPA: pantetheine-phosphate adenylyltransferase [Bacilli bacterium]|nr:MAG: Phosphopantetheine adenylyltransferase [Tenericutes bacterium ADurb.BinA124]HNZ50095.1 pantetheine-phosphate adenylyltransferase [Bacilli bacterium]HPX83926.1 pantetheine-phosphate adenylyltransferase [Bacilli bacterium]HQC74677.1 pantetheine-phosphate adenylyltransferase [Bacilli bacterium]
MKIAVYPGSFDPVSNGHLDIIERVSKVFDKVYVLVSLNPYKTYIFSGEERVELLKFATKHLDNVEVEASNQLVLNYAKQKQAKVIIRGLRNFIDYQNEITLFQFNHSIDQDIDTFVLFPSTNNLFLSSSSIKELVMFDSEIKDYVPAGLADRIKERISAVLNKNSKL